MQLAQHIHADDHVPASGEGRYHRNRNIADGYVTEGAVANAWIVDKDGHVVTRELSHDVLPGVTRLMVLEAAAEAGRPETAVHVVVSLPVSVTDDIAGARARASAGRAASDRVPLRRGARARLRLGRP